MRRYLRHLAFRIASLIRPNPHQTLIRTAGEKEIDMIKATLKRDWEVHDASNPPKAPTKILAPGTYELERIPNPLGYQGNWLVLVGTKTGMAENAWRQWINGTIMNDPRHSDFGKPIDWGDAAIVLEEDGELMTPPEEGFIAQAIPAD